MASVNYEADFVAPSAIRTTSLMNLSAAAASFALIVGLGFWGYELVVRDVSGIPVVKAAEGPLRIMPTNPGGDVSENTGLAVNHISAQGEAAPAPDALLLAPQGEIIEPGDLVAPELALVPDEPIEAVLFSSESETFEGDLTDIQSVSLTESDRDAAVLNANVDDAQILALVEKITLDSSAEAGSAVSMDQATPSDILPASVPGLNRTIRPRARPETLLASLEVRGDLVSSPVAISEVPQSLVHQGALPVGTNLIQLGAFSTPEIAADEWQRLSQLFPAYLDGKTRVILEATSGGVSFYRLRAMGFSGADEARRLCSTFLTQNVECTPVSVR